MTPIEQVAREAGVWPELGERAPNITDFRLRLARFATLVAAAERQAAWLTVNAMIQEGDLGGDGCDMNAQRNGVILAAHALLRRASIAAPASAPPPTDPPAG